MDNACRCQLPPGVANGRAGVGGGESDGKEERRREVGVGIRS